MRKLKLRTSDSREGVTLPGPHVYANVRVTHLASSYQTLVMVLSISKEANQAAVIYKAQVRSQDDHSTVTKGTPTTDPAHEKI